METTTVHLTQALHRALQQFPDQPMTVYGDRVRTTRQVADRVARLAAGLQSLGVRRGDRVGIMALNSDRYHEFFLATWWLGAVAHPVNIRWSSAEVAYAVNDSATEVILLDDTFAALAPALRERCTVLRTVVFCGDGPLPADMVDYEALVAGASPIADAEVGDESLALLLYTGGTTGVPKGVMVSHRGLFTACMGTAIANRAPLTGDTTLQNAPLFHIAAVATWYCATMMGGTQVFLPMFTPKDFLDTVQTHQVNYCILIPVMVQMLDQLPERDAYDTSALHTVTYGGAAASEALVLRAMEMFPTAGFTQGYGQTETGVLTILGREDHTPTSTRLRSAGRSLPHVELKVVDGEGNTLPAGVVGEVVTRGRHTMLGYWGKPEQTAETLVDGWVHTGDGGYLDEHGYLYIADRLKDMIISGGENVYSAEVENALSAHPAVSAAAVIGIPDERWGERVHAIVVIRPGHAVTAAEIRDHAKTLIAGYKCPRSVEFVDALPMSAAGKTLKRELRDERAAATPLSWTEGEESPVTAARSGSAR
jgi:long-chain acyl-CoA synthetase